MLFTESDFMIGANTSEDKNFNDILGEAVFLDEEECALQPVAVPVVENTRIGALVANFSDIERLSEENNIDYIDAVYAVAESNDVNFGSIAVAIDEARIIADPELIDEVANVVVRPISENSDAYVFVDMLVEAYAKTGDVDFLNYMLEAEKADEKDDKVVSDTAAEGDKAEAEKVDGFLAKIKKYAIDKPKEWIAERIAALNAKMVEYRQKLEAKKAEGKDLSIFQQILKKIASCIEWLTEKLTSAKRREAALAARKTAAEKAEDKAAAADTAAK